MEVAVTVATIFVDMQVDFFLPHPRLTRNRLQLTANVNALATIARRNGSHVIWIQQVFATDLHDAPLDVKRGGHRIVIEGTDGAKLLSEIDVCTSDLIVIKKRYSAFFGTNLHSVLDGMACKRIVVAGVNTHACVRSTVVDAYQRDYDVLLALDCIDSHDEQHHSISMRYMDGKLGVAMTNDQIDTELRRCAKFGSSSRGAS
jgi:nicotinamidase-related amidase